jgi:hypothetical protein
MGTALRTTPCRRSSTVSTRWRVTASGKKSSGLGLALVREVASLHGGEADFANHPEGGAMARLLLPLSAEGVDLTSPSIHRASPPLPHPFTEVIETPSHHQPGRTSWTRNCFSNSSPSASCRLLLLVPLALIEDQIRQRSVRVRKRFSAASPIALPARKR